MPHGFVIWSVYKKNPENKKQQNQKPTTKHQKEVNPIWKTWVLGYVSVILKRVIQDSSLGVHLAMRDKPALHAMVSLSQW